MKKSNVAFLFHKHDTQKVANCASPIPVVDEVLSIHVVEDPPIVNDTLWIKGHVKNNKNFSRSGDQPVFH
jgi:hypothetical protein